MNDFVNHPRHYTSHPSGVECIEITEHMNFNLGNAVKYIWRASLKGKEIEDLRKARWYVDREIWRLVGDKRDYDALRQTIEQAAKQEPVAWMVYTLDSTAAFVTLNPADFTGEHRALPLYTTPQPQEFACSTDKEKLAQWMIQRGYATGHGDSIEDLLKELEWQVQEREREACAKVAEQWPYEDERMFSIAQAIRSRGEQ